MISIREIKNVPDGYVLPVFWREWLAVVGYLFYTRAFPFLSSCEFAVPSNLVSYRNKRNALCELDYLLNSILSPLVTTFRKNNNLCYTAPLVLRPRNSTLVLYNRSTKSYQFSNTVYCISYGIPLYPLQHVFLHRFSDINYVYRIKGRSKAEYQE